MEFDKDERNPIYPGALRLSDVDEGVPYREINVRNEVVDVGVFTSAPTIVTNIFGPTYLASVHRNGGDPCKRRNIHLEDGGICKYYNGTWNDAYFTISDTPEGITKYQDWLASNGGNLILEEYARAWDRHIKAMRSQYDSHDDYDEDYDVYEEEGY